MSLNRSRSRKITATSCLALFGSTECHFESVHEQLAVGQRRKGVVDGGVREALAQRPSLRDVLDLADQVKRPLLLVADARDAHRDPDLVSVVMYVPLFDLVTVRSRSRRAVESRYRSTRGRRGG